MNMRHDAQHVFLNRIASFKKNHLVLNINDQKNKIKENEEKKIYDMNDVITLFYLLCRYAQTEFKNYKEILNLDFMSDGQLQDYNLMRLSEPKSHAVFLVHRDNQAVIATTNQLELSTGKHQAFKANSRSVKKSFIDLTTQKYAQLPNSCPQTELNEYWSRVNQYTIFTQIPGSLNNKKENYLVEDKPMNGPHYSNQFYS